MDLIILKTAKPESLDTTGRKGRITLTTIDNVDFALEIETFSGAAELITAALSMAMSAGPVRDAPPSGTAPPPAGAILLAPSRYDVRPSPGKSHVALAARFGVIDLEFHMPIHELRRIGNLLLEAAAKAAMEPKSIQ